MVVWRISWRRFLAGGLVVAVALAIVPMALLAVVRHPRMGAAIAEPAAGSAMDAAPEGVATEPAATEPADDDGGHTAPTVVTVALAPGEDGARDAIERWMASWPEYAPEPVDWTAERVDVYIGPLPPNADLEAILLETTPWVPVTHFTSDVDGLSLDDLRLAFTGELSSWVDLGGPDVPIARVLVAPDRTVEEALGVVGRDDVDVISAEELAERADELAKRPGLLMVLPLPLADPRFRALTLDGGSPLLRRGSEAEYPLVSERWLGLRPDGWEREDGGRFRAGLARFVVAELARPTPRVATLTAVGDVIFGRKVDETIVAYGDYTRPFHSVGQSLREADLTIANLECTLTDAVRPPHDWSTFSFGTSAKAVEGLRFAGIDVVSLANNHSRDMGPEPFVEMLGVLGEAGIAHVGGGRDLAEAHAPHLVEVRGTRYAFLGFDEIGSGSYGATIRTPGTAAMSVEAVRRDVAAAREQADVVIPFFHWGTEYTNRPTERQRRVAHAAVEAGATMVIGSHAHWVQAVEFYEGAFIAYGLGNFVFDQSWSTETTQGVIMHGSFVDGRLASIRFVPVQIQDLHQPQFVDRGTGRRILDRMYEASEL